MMVTMVTISVDRQHYVYCAYRGGSMSASCIVSLIVH